jgi:hypothetical protein
MLFEKSGEITQFKPKRAKLTLLALICCTGFALMTTDCMLFRLYGPLPPWFDKTWRVGEVELVQ